MRVVDIVLSGFAVCWAMVVLAVLFRIERHVGDVLREVRCIERTARRLRGDRER